MFSPRAACAHRATFPTPAAPNDVRQLLFASFLSQSRLASASPRRHESSTSARPVAVIVRLCYERNYGKILGGVCSTLHDQKDQKYKVQTFFGCVTSKPTSVDKFLFVCVERIQRVNQFASCRACRNHGFFQKRASRAVTRRGNFDDLRRPGKKANLGPGKKERRHEEIRSLRKILFTFILNTLRVAYIIQ